MALRSRHGKATAHGEGPVIEVLPADELPDGLPVHARAPSPGDRGGDGRFARGNSFASKGGEARMGKSRLVARLGLQSLPPESAFAPYKRSAVRFCRAHCAELARTVGGGRCGAAPSSLVGSASLQLAWSRFLSDRAAATGDLDAATRSARLANDSRQNLLAAHELCAREAMARVSTPNEDDVPDWARATILAK